MKKLILMLTVIALSLFVMASCENGGTTDGGNDCLHENTIETNAKRATCVSEGREAGTVCADCGTYISGGKVIPLSDHGPFINAPKIEPTCERDGSEASKRCSFCREFVVAPVTIPKLPHEFVDSKDVAPTCSEPGSTGGTHCSACFTPGTPATPIAIDPTAHDFGEWTLVTPAAEGVHGVESRTCKDCSETETRDVHFYAWTETAPATESAHGTETGTCTVVGCTATDTKETHFYTWVETTPAQVGVAGEKTGTCFCGDTVTEVIPALTAPEENSGTEE